MVIDTSIFIEYLRASNKHKTTLFALLNDQEFYISSISIYELHMGATNQQKKKDIQLLTENLTVLEFNEITAIKASEIYHELRVKNKMIEFRDIFIAATCIVNDLPIKTLNHKHFNRIKDLLIV
jgi:tRNA(fMet)-specific endonuclease VapC